MRTSASGHHQSAAHRRRRAFLAAQSHGAGARRQIRHCRRDRGRHRRRKTIYSQNMGQLFACSTRWPHTGFDFPPQHPRATARKFFRTSWSNTCRCARRGMDPRRPLGSYAAPWACRSSCHSSWVRCAIDFTTATAIDNGAERRHRLGGRLLRADWQPMPTITRCGCRPTPILDTLRRPTSCRPSSWHALPSWARA